MILWPRAIPRRIRFHDLRHCAATLMLRAGVDLHRVQRLPAFGPEDYCHDLQSSAGGRPESRG
jgi:hypothetical protein